MVEDGGRERLVRRVRRVVLVLAASYLSVIALGWLLQDRLVYLRSPAPPPIEEVLEDGEEVQLRTVDGLELAAWWMPAEPAAWDGGTPPAVIYLPGNAGNRGGGRSVAAEELAARGLSVLLVDYRGYGGNPGQPSEAGLTADALAALAHLRGREDVDPERIAYLGESLGTGVATNLAMEEGPVALVLRSPFTWLGAVPESTFRWLPYRWILRDHYASVDRIGLVEAPVLVITGSEDEVVPVSLSVELFEAASEPKELVIVEGASHVDRAFVDGDEYLDAVEAFVRRAIRESEQR